MSLQKRRTLRRRAFQAQQCKCFYCQYPMWTDDPEAFARREGMPFKLAKYLRCTAEHLLARQNSGEDTQENIVAACFWCNQARHRGRQHRAPDWASYKAKVEKLISRGRWHPVAASAVSSGKSMQMQSRCPRAGHGLQTLPSLPSSVGLHGCVG